MSFEELPLEILLRIFDYLSPIDLWCNFRTVNRTLNIIVRDKSYWFRRANRRYGLVLSERLKVCRLRQLTDDTDLSPIYRCIATEKAANRWSNMLTGLDQSVSTTGVHYANVDAIQLFTINQKYFSLTGARDRQIVLWDLSTNWVCVPIEKAHDGWIWSISCPKYNVYTFFSAGWDSTVKKWQITEASIRPIQKINVNTAALSCIAENENIFYVSTFRGGPLLYDTRMACTSPIASNNCHGQKPVFELATKSNSNQIFSIGDDNKLVALDKRRFESLTGSYQSMGSISHVDYEDRQLCLSLKSGHFLFFDPETLQLENELNIFNDDGTPFNGDQNIRISRGATFCACSDSSLHVFSPGIQPQQIARIKLGGNITRMDVLDEHMVATTTIDKLHYWPNIESIN